MKKFVPERDDDPAPLLAHGAVLAIRIFPFSDTQQPPGRKLQGVPTSRTSTTSSPHMIAHTLNHGSAPAHVNSSL